jgi:hypothetical protein
MLRVARGVPLCTRNAESLAAHEEAVAKLMRLAKPDDVFEFVRVADIVELWPRLERLRSP